MLGRIHVQCSILIVLAIVLRCATFGDPNLFVDEAFYFASGIEMHHGALPFVGVWDRKPFGSFAIFYLISAVSHSPAAYQIAAALCAGATSSIIAVTARRFTGARGALLAGVAYLLMLPVFSGYGGQTPVFYNLLVALAAMLVLNAAPRLREGQTPPSVSVAMLLAGFAVTIKTTVLFEAAFLGFYASWALFRSGASAARTAAAVAGWAVIGAAPSLAIAFGYWLAGYWPEFWQAMATSNIAKQPSLYSGAIRAGYMLPPLTPLLLFGALGLSRLEPGARRFLLGWLLAAFVGLVSVPNFYLHYALPITVPLCLAASPALDRGKLGVIGVAVIAAMSALVVNPFDFAHTRRSQDAMENLARAVQAHGGERGLLVYDGPPMLYAMTGHRFPTPLAFPPHLNHAIERNVSTLQTAAEVRRVLDSRPGVVVLTPEVRNKPANGETRAMMLTYIASNCRLVTIQDTPERMRSDKVAVYGDCMSGRSPRS